MRGFSVRNLQYMVQFAESYSTKCLLMDKVKNPEERLYYTHRTLEEGWSTRVLVHKVEQKLYES